MNVYKYLPFMDKEDLEELVEKIKTGEVTEVPLYKLFPFLSKERLDTLVDYMIEKQDNKNLTRSLPFISSNSLDKIKQAIDEGKLEDFDDARLLPFMDASSIKDLFYAKLKKHKETTEDSEEDSEE
ncbi:MAG: hypothetical protein ACVCEJ_06420 [Candidatus Izemoplasmataceae bacterium]